MLIVSKISDPHITYLPLFKVQNIQIEQTIFQERKEIADLVLQTATGKIEIPCIEYQRAIMLYNYILYKVETSTKSWM